MKAKPKTDSQLFKDELSVCRGN